MASKKTIIEPAEKNVRGSKIAPKFEEEIPAFPSVINMEENHPGPDRSGTKDPREWVETQSPEVKLRPEKIVQSRKALKFEEEIPAFPSVINMEENHPGPDRSGTKDPREWVETQSPEVKLRPGKMVQSRKRYNPLWLVVSKKRRLAITIIPKVMCSSIRVALSTIECGDPKRRCAEARRNKSLKTTNLSNMTRLVVFRDPFERLYSAYTNSDTIPDISLQHCHNKSMCTFEEWVVEMTTEPSHFFRNEHFKPQKEVSQIDAMHYHYFLRLSSKVDQEFFWNTLVQSDKVLNQNQSDKKTNLTTIEVFKTFPRSTLDRIATMYEKDLLLWEQILRDGTPRQENEVTVFDYYKQLQGNISSGADYNATV